MLNGGGSLTCQDHAWEPCAGPMGFAILCREHRCQGCLGSCSGEPRGLAAPQLWLQVLAPQADMVVPRALGVAGRSAILLVETMGSTMAAPPLSQ